MGTPTEPQLMRDALSMARDIAQGGDLPVYTPVDGSRIAYVQTDGRRRRGRKN